MLEALVVALDATDVRLVFAELRDPVRARIADCGLGEVLTADRFYPTLEAAVADHLSSQRRRQPTEGRAGDRP